MDDSHNKQQDKEKSARLRKCFSMFASAQACGRITPEEAAFAICAMDPTASSVPTDQIQATIAAELFVSEEEIGKLSLFEAAAIYHQHAQEEVVTFAAFESLFDGKEVFLSAPEALRTAIANVAQIRSDVVRVVENEEAHRKAIVQEEGYERQQVEPEARRTIQIAKLRAKYKAGCTRNRSDEEYAAFANPNRVESQKQEELRALFLKNKAAQGETLAANTAFEERYDDVVEAIAVAKEQADVMLQWKEKALVLSHRQLKDDLESVVLALSEREEDLSKRMEYVESRIVLVGQRLLHASVTAQGGAQHRNVLQHMYEANQLRCRQPSDVSGAAQRGGDAGAVDFTWLQRDSSGALLANLAEPLHDAQNVEFLPLEVASQRQYQFICSVGAAFELLCRRPDADDEKSSIPSFGAPGAACLMEYEQFAAFVRQCRLEVPGNVKLTFLEFADAKPDAAASVSESSFSRPSAPSLIAMREQSKYLVSTFARMSLTGFVKALESIASSLYFPQLAKYVTGEYLVRRLLDERINPRLHRLTVKRALSPSPTNASLVETLWQARELVRPALPALTQCFLEYAARCASTPPLLRERIGLVAEQIRFACHISAARVDLMPVVGMPGCSWRLLDNPSLTTLLMRDDVCSYVEELGSAIAETAVDFPMVQRHASLYGCACWIRFAAPTLSSDQIIQSVVTCVTQLVASTFLPKAGSEEREAAAPASVRSSLAALSPQRVLECVWSVAPMDDPLVFERAPIPFIIALAAAIRLSEDGVLPPLAVVMRRLSAPKAELLV